MTKIRATRNKDFKFDLDKPYKIIGLSIDSIYKISEFRHEPKWCLDLRLKAFNTLQEMKVPTWMNIEYEVDINQFSVFSGYSDKETLRKKLISVEKEKMKRLGIPLSQSSTVALEFVLDSNSVFETQKKELEKLGILFCSISEAIQLYPDIVQKYLCSVVNINDNYFATLNAAFFSDGTFVFIPSGVKCPIDLASYFRINDPENAQFERTLIIAESSSSVTYLEGCSSPKGKSQFHAAVVEIICLDYAHVNYTTLQNWRNGNKDGLNNLVTKRGNCIGKNSYISFTQIEVGAKKSVKFPSIVLSGEGSVGEFYSISLVKNTMEMDTGTKMIHLANNTKSVIVSKSISMGKTKSTFRSLVHIAKNADNCETFSNCSSFILDKNSSVYMLPTFRCNNSTASIKHEAKTSSIDYVITFFLACHAFADSEILEKIVYSALKEIISKLPKEFRYETSLLLKMKLGNKVG